MIGYDLDGVLVCDLDIHFTEISTHELYKHRNVMKPLFIPQGNYFLLSGRPKYDLPLVKRWVDKYLVNNPPSYIIMERESLQDDVMKYKENALRKFMIEHRVEAYIESNMAEYTHLLETLGTYTRIIHFSTFIKDIIAHSFMPRV